MRRGAILQQLVKPQPLSHRSNNKHSFMASLQRQRRQLLRARLLSAQVRLSCDLHRLNNSNSPQWCNHTNNCSTNNNYSTNNTLQLLGNNNKESRFQPFPPTLLLPSPQHQQLQLQSPLSQPPPQLRHPPHYVSNHPHFHFLLKRRPPLCSLPLSYLPRMALRSSRRLQQCSP